MKNQSDIILSVKNIVNRFGKQVVHDGVSFDVKRGEVLGIVGGSGAGKSVLLKTMIGLRSPNEGEVEIEGTPIKKISLAESASLLGVMFQEGALFSSLSVMQNIMLPLREHVKLPKKTLRALAQLKLALVGLSQDTGKKYPSELSGGMTKRVALARALAMDPIILFLDEPTAGLDPVSASAFDQLIMELNKSLGVTVIMVTHDLDTLFTVCDRVAVLLDKKVIIDTLSNLMKIDHPWIREYFHGPRAIGAESTARAVYGNK
jgi:phospholipid/cholesterol/gamma-HCH transport system ATP-binding protein